VILNANIRCNDLFFHLKSFDEGVDTINGHCVSLFFLSNLSTLETNAALLCSGLTFTQ